MKCYVGRSEKNYNRCLLAHVGSIAFFSQPLATSVLEGIKSADDYDNVVLQFNAAVMSSSLTASAPLSGGSAAAAPSAPASAGAPHEGLVFAFDARSYDEKHKLLLDASSNDSVWQMGGPMIFLRLSVSPLAEAGPLDFNACQTMTHPLGPLSIPKMISLLAETLRHSTTNKFVCRRSHTIPLLALLLRSLPTTYLTPDLLGTVERLLSAVASDRYLCDDIQKNLLSTFNYTIFEKLHMSIKKTLIKPHDEIAGGRSHLRNRVLETIHMLLYDPEAWKQGQKKSLVSGLGLIGAAPPSSMMLSFDAARTLICSMFGMPTNPDGIVDDAIKVAVREVEIDAGSIAEYVSDSDIPTCCKSVFGRLGGLRIWLPLIATDNAPCNLNATPTLKPSLSTIDVRMILGALNVQEYP
ncbi:hypothetical protein SPRG_03433 [Saprolegnia parasitica CBS 223.65]|uniref:DUF4704 domain-containing protein n=1 Tax=Saprolegnia parasitica (strain CBS 223.65) TaxID=695850 RepID=A0A067CZL5_SAPPC|nr:hypothetical protein SPRG_03433 [Saprolegnia parasitica CBS 223.65]KDO32217.1 hypothetical protein SPRG_03433 [Saprolegnia parasitica CBS 223.65]|eukprot:XP_012197394.1 hypothetical protein SPRG_03433 [Saprolegnia parasitica CBS 223.65]